jgi:isocitrate lyase
MLEMWKGVMSEECMIAIDYMLCENAHNRSDMLPCVGCTGHMAGKVLVSIREHIDRLVAARLQADIMKTETYIVARTDAEAATLLDSNVDPRDHPFIVGSTNPTQIGLNDAVNAAEAKGASQAELVDITQKWDKQAGLMTYGAAVVAALNAAGLQSKVAAFQVQEKQLSNLQARVLAKSLGVEPYWCWDKPRAREGYYAYDGGLDACVQRAKAYAPYADLIWMETKSPVLADARHFSTEVSTRVRRSTYSSFA